MYCLLNKYPLSLLIIQLKTYKSRQSVIITLFCDLIYQNTFNNNVISINFFVNKSHLSLSSG